MLSALARFTGLSPLLTDSMTSPRAAAQSEVERAFAQWWTEEDQVDMLMEFVCHDCFPDAKLVER